MSESGHYVEIIGTQKDTDFPKPPSFNSNVSFSLLRQNYKKCRNYESTDSNSKFSYSFPKPFKRSKLKRIIPEFIKSPYRLLKNFFHANSSFYHDSLPELIRTVRYIIFAINCCLKKRYDIAIGIDSYGIITSQIASFFTKFQAQYFWSLEITDRNLNDIFNALVKSFESLGHYKSDFLISQDKLRGEDLCLINKVRFNKSYFFCVPHSRNESVSFSSNNFFRDKFKISSNGIILLHAGWIHEIMDSFHLSRSTKCWPDNLNLVFHERMNRSMNETYIQKVSSVCSSRTFFSLNPVPYDELEGVIKSADIGIINYNLNSKSPAWSNLAKASGKIADYLSCGLPVICPPIKGLSKIVTDYKCGEVFHSYDEIPLCVNRIITDYERYQKNALNCFIKEYKFSKYFNPVLYSMQRVSNLKVL